MPSGLASLAFVSSKETDATVYMSRESAFANITPVASPCAFRGSQLLIVLSAAMVFKG